MTAPRTKQFLQVPLAALTAILTVFHLRLLWLRVADRTVLEPGVVLEWAIALLLLLVALRARQAGISLFHGRRALAFWLIVLLLHAVAIGPQTDGLEGYFEVRVNTELLVLAPLGVALGLVLGAGLRRLDRIRRRRISSRSPGRLLDRIESKVRPRGCLCCSLIPRAPPA